MRLFKQLLTKNRCYLVGAPLKPKGVMVHSTAVNNPNISRYVGPDDGFLGPVSRGNWNQYRPGGTDKCVHAFIGKLADGSIGSYQTLPWNMKGWHCGGKANNTHIGFEICEDSTNDPVYFGKVYREAVELTAYLCKLYHLDPLADGVVICHCEGHSRGIASNHADVMHWFPKHGKSMDIFRRDVSNEMKKPDKPDKKKEDEMSYTDFEKYMKRWEAEQSKLPATMADLLAEAKKVGVTDGTRPVSNASRQECAVMVLAAHKNLLDKLENGSYETFVRYLNKYLNTLRTEEATMPDLVERAVSLGITDGTRPMDNASRQECAAMVSKSHLDILKEIEQMKKICDEIKKALANGDEIVISLKHAEPNSQIEDKE